MDIFLGIDIAKDSLTVYDGHQTYTFPNERKLRRFHRFLKKRYRGQEEGLVFIYEPTGPYSAFFEEFCAREKLRVVKLNPRKVPYLQEVLGQRAKTDHLDAQVLYAYGKLVNPSEIRVLKLDERREKLAALFADYQFLRRQEIKFANHLEALERNPFSSVEMKRFIRKELGIIRRQIKEVLRMMKELVKEDKELEGAVEKVEEIPGIGFLTALGLALFFKRKGVRRREEVAALLGLDPMVRESGKGQGVRRISRRGDKLLRSLLYMAALCAIRRNPEIREFYERLRSRGKPGKVAVVACMRKLALISWAYYKMAIHT
jgi:transposase